MSPLDVFKTIAMGTEVATRIASLLGVDREHVIRVAADEVARLTAEPPDVAGPYFAARHDLLADQDERSELDRKPKDTDRAPPPKPSER